MIFEINTWVWLAELGARLDTLTDEQWDATLPPAIDAVWLMGVWARSPIGARIARDRLAGEVPADDVVGSAYCVRDYHVDERLGGDTGLAAARAALDRRGLRLILDYVPNHVAPDHPWVTERPEAFLPGLPSSPGNGSNGDMQIGDRWFALGRDPYFPPWRDVLQLHAFSPALREAATAALAAIAGQCDGVRCDMAMLFLDDVFSSTWGDRAGWPLPQPYWPSVIGPVKEEHPEFRFIAEAYWDLEWALLEQGFDACYDKRLYDRLAGLDPRGVRAHLGADLAYQQRMVRFIENHDEPRAALTWTPEQGRACAIATATLPGWFMLYEGQLDGRRVRPPVELGRRPAEPPDAAVREFYLRLLPAAAAMRTGQWQQCPTSGWPDNATHERLLAWAWLDGDGAGNAQEAWLVVVNLAGTPSQGRVSVAWPAAPRHTIAAADEVTGQTFERDGNELLDPGLYVDLVPWQCHVLRLTSH